MSNIILTIRRNIFNQFNLTVFIIFSLSLLLALSIVNYRYTSMFMISTFILIISAFLVSRTGILWQFGKMTVVTFFWFTYLLMIYFPSFFVYFSKPGPYRNVYLIAVQSVLITVPLGAMIANKLFWLSRNSLNDFFDSKIQAFNDPHVRRLFVIVISFCIFFTGLFFLETKKIPLLEIFRYHNMYDLLRIFRAESFLLSKSRFIYIYSWLRGFFFPFLIIFSFGNMLVTKDKFWRNAFFVALIFGVFYNSLSLEKLPVASIFIMLAIYYLNLMKWRVNWILWVVAPILIIAGPTIILLLVMPKEQIFFQKIFNSLFSRIIYTPAEAIYYYFEVFPDKIGFLGGTSIKTLSTILGTGYFNAPEFVFRYWFHLPFTIGAASAGFIAIIYANWGMLGVFLIGFVTGFLIHSGQIAIRRNKKTVLSLAFISFLMYSAWLLNSIDLFVILQTDGVIVSIFIYWLFLRAYKKSAGYDPIPDFPLRI